MIHPLAKAIIMLGFSLLVAYLTYTGEIVRYIEPEMVLPVKGSAVILFAAAVFQLFSSLRPQAHRHSPNCGCEHHKASPFKKTAIYVLFLLPLLLGFFIPGEGPPRSDYPAALSEPPGGDPSLLDKK
ncbi:DUF1980 domain-containing protein [Paenibacillus sp. GCM10027627]|uniref:DUF1980 domain-containing protein n=1 Tax=unclassified Paenibacillus TaxID=185978 RepID=UPI0036327748